MTKPVETPAQGDSERGPDGAPRPSRRPYRSPLLTEYGHIGKLTRGGSGPFAETAGHRLHKCL